MKKWLKNRIGSQRNQRKNRFWQRNTEVLEQRTLLAAFTWNTDADGNWNDPANWAGPGGVPGDGDDVTIDRAGADPVITVDTVARAESLLSTEQIVVDGGNLQVDTTAAIKNVSLLDGEFDVDGTATLTGQLHWQGGDLFTIDLQVTSIGTLQISDSADRFSGRIKNAGQVLQEVPLAIPFGGTAFQNLPDGVWDHWC